VEMAAIPKIVSNHPSVDLSQPSMELTHIKFVNDTIQKKFDGVKPE
jgi:hypothetical protein